jgi:hypothetical protein
MKEVHRAEQSLYITQEKKLGSGVQIFSKIFFPNFNSSVVFIYTDCRDKSAPNKCINSQNKLSSKLVELLQA